MSPREAGASASMATPCLVGVLTLLVCAAPARSQPHLRDEWRALSLTVPQASLAPAKEPRRKKPWFQWDRRPELRLGEMRVDFRARVQIDRRRSDAPIGDEDELSHDVSRKRIGLEGSYGEYVEFQVERELEDSLDPWRDVFANYRQFDEVQFQYGKFKLPFSLDENTGATNLDFVRRSLAANILAPGRDRGWMVHGRVLDRRVRYELGVFEHDGRNARTRRGDRVYGGETQALRVVGQPFRPSKSVAQDVLIGVAWTWSDVSEGYSGLRGQTVFGHPFLSSDYLIRGPRQRVGFEMRWRPGPLSVKTEYMKVTDERLGQSVEDTDLSPLRAVGWYVSGTWAITGDRKAEGLDEPKRPLFHGGIGAVEIAARLERLTFVSVATSEPPSTSYRADVILGNSDRAMTLGANWYPNRWVKIQFNLIQETLTDPAQGPLPSRPRFWSRVLRVQVQL